MFKPNQIALILASNLLVCGVTSAENLGVAGKTFEIVEPDFRVVIADEVARVDMGKAEEKLKKEINSFEENGIKSFDLPTINESETRYVDISVTASRDIYAPIEQPDGSFKKSLVVAKGQRANPLDTYRPPTALFFIDGRSKEQLEFAKAALKHDPIGVDILLTAGSAMDVSTEWGRGVYRAFPHMITQMEITNTPALLRAGSGEHKDFMAVTYFAKPFSSEEFKQNWKPVLSTNE